MKVSDIIERSAAAWPERPALIDEAGALTFAELRQAVQRTRRRLEALGVGPGQGVGVRARNGRAFVIAAFAASGCGAVVMPVSPQLKEAELQALLAAAPLRAIIDDGSAHARIRGASSALDDSAAAPLRLIWTGPPRGEAFAPHVPEAAFARFTSGTTGDSKGVVLTHQDTLERADAANQGLALGPEDVVLWVLPMAFHFFVSIILYLRVGATVVVCRDHLAETILADAERWGATFFYGSPLHYRLLAADASARGLAGLKRAISTSTGLDPAVARAFQERFGLPVTQAYGIIEVGLPLINLRDAAEYPEAVGRALPGCEAAILDAAGRPLPPGAVGELAVRGPGMFSAYLQPPKMRADVLRDGWFMTGDLAARDESGLIAIKGRAKSTINVGGEKVFPEEVEAVLGFHPAVARARVSGRPHPRLGEVVHADVVLQDAAAPVEPEELLKFCRRQLSGFKTPQSVDFALEIEETPSGKTSRR